VLNVAAGTRRTVQAERTPTASAGSGARPARPAFRITGTGASTAGERAAPARRQGVDHRRQRPLPNGVARELAEALPARRVARYERQLALASAAYARDRYGEALKILQELVRIAPGVAAARELYGLTLYRLGRWREASRELLRFHELTGSFDQHPALADAQRALGHHDEVGRLWQELRRAGATSDVLAEGRLVMAGSLADRGRIAEAIALVEPAATRVVRRPQQRHLRQWYVLADLYERAGDAPRARELFRKVVEADPDLADATARLAALS